MTNPSEQSFTHWLYQPKPEDMVCASRFREVVRKVFDGFSPLDPYAPDPNDPETKVAQLMLHDLILLAGDAIYVREGATLHTLGDAIPLLAYYMHTDSREARKAADLLESNFQGYFPVVDGKVAHNAIDLIYPNEHRRRINLATLREMALPTDPSSTGFWAEFGQHNVDEGAFEPLAKFFDVMDKAVNEQWFFEKALLYPLTRPYREKSHVLVGGGGNGKSLFMGLVQRLYGDRALTDAPQPNFKGHDAAVISYSLIGKRVVTFNDVGDPSAKFLEWMKRMITGNLEVKTPSGAWLSVPCQAGFMMETNHVPEVLGLEAHRRRFIIREFDEDFRLKEHMANEELDVIGEKGSIGAGDIVNYLLLISSQVDDWTYFEDRTEEGGIEDD